MGFFQDLFSSPQENAARKEMSASQNDYDSLMRDIQGTQSIYSDPGRMAQIGSAVNQQFGAARSNVATSNARARSAAARRMGANNATPEMTYGNVDASFAPAYGQVEEAAQRETGNVLAEQDQFSFNKLGARGSALNSKQSAIQGYLKSLSDTSPVGGVLRAATSIAGIPTGENSTFLTSLLNRSGGG